MFVILECLLCDVGIFNFLGLPKNRQDIQQLNTIKRKLITGITRGPLKKVSKDVLKKRCESAKNLFEH